MQKVRVERVTIAGQHVALDAATVERTMRAVLPEPIRDHFVVIAARRFPPKQVIYCVTHIDRADFTTNQARSILRRLGFTTSRLSSRTGDTTMPYEPSESDWGKEEAERLRPFLGQWVVLKDKEVIVSGAAPEELILWLRKHNVKGDSLFRVPLDARVDMGGFSGG